MPLPVTVPDQIPYVSGATLHFTAAVSGPGLLSSFVTIPTFQLGTRGGREAPRAVYLWKAQATDSLIITLDGSTPDTSIYHGIPLSTAWQRFPIQAFLTNNAVKVNGSGLLCGMWEI